MNECSISVCQGCPGRRRGPARWHAVWYRATSSWAISRTALRTRALVFCHSLPFKRDKSRLFAPRVRPQGVDLVGGHVKFVAVAVFEQSIVALDVANRAFDHAAETGHAVLEMHDVVPGLHVVEEGGHLGGPWPGRPVGPPAAREVALGQDRQSERRVYETPVDRGYDNVSAAACPDVESAAHSRPVCNFGNDALVLQRLGQPRCAPLVLGADDDRDNASPSASRSWARSRSGPPATGSQPIVLIVGVPGPSGAGVSMATDASVPLKQPVKRQVKTGEIAALVRPRWWPAPPPGLPLPRRSPPPARASAAARAAAPWRPEAGGR